MIRSRVDDRACRALRDCLGSSSKEALRPLRADRRGPKLLDEAGAVQLTVLRGRVEAEHFRAMFGGIFQQVGRSPLPSSRSAASPLHPLAQRPTLQPQPHSGVRTCHLLSHSASMHEPATVVEEMPAVRSQQSAP